MEGAVIKGDEGPWARNIKSPFLLPDWKNSVYGHEVVELGIYMLLFILSLIQGIWGDIQNKCLLKRRIYRFMVKM